MTALLSLIFGGAFGYVLSRSGAADYNYIQRMFLLESFQLYGIIGTAVVLTAPVIWLLKQRGRTLSGAAINVAPKPGHRRRRRPAVRRGLVDLRHVSWSDSREHRRGQDVRVRRARGCACRNGALRQAL
jgi:hypothetical protein